MAEPPCVHRRHRFSTQCLVPSARLPPSLPLAFLLLAIALPLAHSQEPNSRLPWEAAPRVAPPALRPPAGPVEVLERFGVGESQLESFFSGQPLSPSEEDVLVKILFQFPRLGLDNLARWRQRGVSWDQVAAAPGEWRAKTFRLAGRAKRVVKHPLLPEQTELYEFDHYFRVVIALDNSPYEALVAARHVPVAWPLDAPIDEPAQADAVFLKVGDSQAERPRLVFAAGRIGWYPDRPNSTHHIGEAQLALAESGMDISLWDDVRQSKEHALTAADREGFYQLLDVVRRLDATHSPLATHHSPDLVALLEKPTEHFGDFMPVEGIARRVMKVPVGDADINSRFGIDHYYEIDLFLPLKDASLRFGGDPTGEKNPIYRNAYPATLIVRDLPPGLKEAENIHELVRADGVFFKVWTYRSNYTSRFGQLQPAPLFIARAARLVPIEAAANWVTGALVMGALALALGVTAIILWCLGPSGRQARAKASASRGLGL